VINIKLLNKEGLHQLINSPEFGELEYIPITIHRALSQMNNPQLDNEDIILLLAYNKKNLVGYLGALPSKILHEEKFERFAWLSCFWVSPSCRGQGVGSQLLNHALQVWDNKLLSADYVEKTKKIYDRTNAFHTIPFEKKGIRLYIRSDLKTILPPKKEIFKKSQPLLRLIDFSFNALFDFRSYFSKNKIDDLRLEYVNEIDNEAKRFIEKRQQERPHLFQRGANELNWIIKNPWILSAPVKDSLSQRYHFSSFEKSFKFYSLKVRNLENELIAFMIFSKRNDVLKLPYLYHINCLDSVINIINHQITKLRITTFTTFQSELVEQLKKVKTPALIKREISRKYLVSAIFKSTLFDQEMEIQDGDADCSFT